MANNNIYDGRHITNGPFQGQLIAELDEDELNISIIVAQDILERIETGAGRCPFKKHRGEYWESVIETDPDYHQFILNGRRQNLAIMTERRDRLRQTRERAEQAREHTQQQQQLESAGPWSPGEIEEVEKNKWIDRLRADWLAGWKRRAIQVHPDHAGGDTEKMKQLNREREVVDKLFPWLKDEK